MRLSVERRLSVLIVPDKDADGLSGTWSPIPASNDTMSS